LSVVDPELLKSFDSLAGTPVIACLALWERIRRLFSPGRARAGADLGRLRRIAVVKTVAIGDLVVAAPAISAIRRRFPDAELTLVTTPRVREVVEGSADLDRIEYFDVLGADAGLSGLIRFMRRVRTHRFDAWIELEHYYRFTTILGYLSGARVRVGFRIPGQVRHWLFTIGVPYPVDAHEVEAFMAIPRALGAPAGEISLVPIATTTADDSAVDGWMEREGLTPASRLVVLHTTTSPIVTSRRWMDDRWVELARILVGRCGLVPVLTGAPDDRESLLALAARVGGEARVAAGDLTLKQFAVLAARAALVVSLDTGPLHVAAATGTPIVGLFGPNTPAKWGPYGPNGAAVWAGLECSPCTRQYLGLVSRCPRDDCMRAIEVAAVMGAVASLPATPCPLAEAGTDEGI
jgi:ADP-heptose:LPS heptosyltransferase